MKLKMTLLMTVLLIAGCPATNPLKTDATGDAITRATVRNQSAAVQVDLAKPHADSTGKVHLDTASSDLKTQSADLTEAKSALKVERDNAAKLWDEKQKLESKWYVRWGKKIESALKWIIASLVIGLVLRIASQFVGGWAGSAMAYISTAIFGAATGGVSLVQAGFDNLHFRRRKGETSVSNSPQQ